MALARLFVRHPVFEAAFEDVAGMIRKAMYEPWYEGSLLVTGPPGAGKTTLVGRIVEHFRDDVDGEPTEPDDDTPAEPVPVHVLSLACPTRPTRARLVSAMLDALGSSQGSVRRLGDRRLGLLQALHDAFVSAIVIDEAQRVLERDGRLKRHDVAELLTELHDESFAVVLVGLDRALGLIRHDEQIKSRWSSPVRLDGYGWGEPGAGQHEVPDSRYAFMGLLRSFAGAIALDWCADINFDSEADAFPFFMASRGLPGDLRRLLAGAVDVAEEDGATVIDRSILARAYERRLSEGRRGGPEGNPFAPGPEPRSGPSLAPDWSVPSLRRGPIVPRALRKHRRQPRLGM